jgi:hypothetical protein
LARPRRRKIPLIIIASVCFIVPILASSVFYHDLFSSWIAAISGRIPGQHSPASESCNPSLLCLGQTLAENAGLDHDKLIGGLFYLLAVVLLVLGPFAVSIIRLVQQQQPASLVVSEKAGSITDRQSAVRDANSCVVHACALFVRAPAQGIRLF